MKEEFYYEVNVDIVKQNQDYISKIYQLVKRHVY